MARLGRTFETNNINTTSLKQNGRPYCRRHFQIDAISGMKMLKFRINLHWIVFLTVHFTISQLWFRLWLGTEQATACPVHQVQISLIQVPSTVQVVIFLYTLLALFAKCSPFLTYLWNALHFEYHILHFSAGWCPYSFDEFLSRFPFWRLRWWKRFIILWMPCQCATDQ